MISVVIPTHNRADLLERAVKSVLNQTYQKFEIIIVSDGSTDNTDEVVEKLKNNDKRIRYISYHPGKGGNVARNMGIEDANYENIAFLDDDDEWLPEKLEKQIDILKSDLGIGLVYTGVKSIYVNENITYESRPNESGDLSERIFLKNFIGTTSTVIVKKSLLLKAGLFNVELQALQDYDLWIRIVQHTNVGVITEPCVNYYNYVGNKQISQQTQKYVESIEYIRDYYSDDFSKLGNKEYKVHMQNFNHLLANKAMRNKNRRDALKFSLKAFLCKPNLKSLGFIIMSIIGNYKTVLKLRSNI